MGMEHASPRGSPSIYDDGGFEGDEMEHGNGKIAAVGGLVSNEWKRLGKGLVRGLEVERERERVKKGTLEDAGRWGSSSVESWAPKRVNPEVEMYVGA